jgi:alpha-L-fucosidase
VTTRRGDSVFVHVLDWPDRILAMPALEARVVRASMLRTRAPVHLTQSDSGLTLDLPQSDHEEPDRVIVLELQHR